MNSTYNKNGTIKLFAQGIYLSPIRNRNECQLIGISWKSIYLITGNEGVIDCEINVKNSVDCGIAVSFDWSAKSTEKMSISSGRFV